MCVEEKFVGGFNIPALQAVGWEGAWGFMILVSILVGMDFIPDKTKPTCYFEDSIDAFTQMGNNPIIILAILGNVFSIAFFNFFGISVTKVMSASHRMVLDSVRTFVIWGVSLLIGWEDFLPLQLVGFAVLLFGTAVYNEIVHLPCFDYTEEEDGVDLPNTPDNKPADPYHLLGEDMGSTPTSASNASRVRSFTTVDELHDSFVDSAVRARKSISSKSFVDGTGTPRSSAARHSVRSFTGSFLR